MPSEALSSGMAMAIVVSLRIATKAATSSSQMTRMPAGSMVSGWLGCARECELSLDKEELRSKKVCHRPGAGGTPRATADAAHGQREQRRTTLAYSALVGTGGDPHHPTCAISARKCRRMRLSRSLMCRVGLIVLVLIRRSARRAPAASRPPRLPIARTGAMRSRCCPDVDDDQRRHRQHRDSDQDSQSAPCGHGLVSPRGCRCSAAPRGDELRPFPAASPTPVLC